MRTLRHALVLASIAAPLVSTPPLAPAAEPLHPQWRTCDDAALLPIGVLADATVARDGTVFLLDEQQKVVHVLGASGESLATIGREGEGPGEFWIPAAIAAGNDSCCVVFQHFHAPAVCLELAGSFCAAPDLAVVRQGWTETVVQRAQAIAGGAFVLGVMRGKASGELSGVGEGPHHELVLVDPSGSAPEILLSTVPERATLGALAPRTAGHFVRFGWDVDAEGRLAYIDHLRPGRIEIVSLVTRERSGYAPELDPRAVSGVADLERTLGMESGALSMASDLVWIDAGRRILLRTVAAASGRVPGLGPEDFEVHDLSARERSPTRVDVGLEPDEDLLRMRNGWLLVVRGAAMARREQFARWSGMLGRATDPQDAIETTSDERICVELYDLSKLVEHGRVEGR